MHRLMLRAGASLFYAKVRKARSTAGRRARRCTGSCCARAPRSSTPRCARPAQQLEGAQGDAPAHAARGRLALLRQGPQGLLQLGLHHPAAVPHPHGRLPHAARTAVGRVEHVAGVR